MFRGLLLVLHVQISAIQHVIQHLIFKCYIIVGHVLGVLRNVLGMLRNVLGVLRNDLRVL